MPKSRNRRDAISYIRASTNANLQKNAFGNQEYAINSFAEANGYDIGIRFAEYVSAYGESVRTEWTSALNHIEDNPECTLIIHKADRASRSLREWTDVESRGLLPRIRFANQSDTVPDIFLVHILIAVAENESRATSKRVKDTIAKLRREAEEKGEPFIWGGQTGFTDEGRLKGRAKIKENALDFANRIIFQIHSENKHIEGKPLRDCTLAIQVEYLNNKRLFTRRGKRWTISGLHRVLNYPRVRAEDTAPVQAGLFG